MRKKPNVRGPAFGPGFPVWGVWGLWPPGKPRAPGRLPAPGLFCGPAWHYCQHKLQPWVLWGSHLRMPCSTGTPSLAFPLPGGPSAHSAPPLHKLRISRASEAAATMWVEGPQSGEAEQQVGACGRCCLPCGSAVWPDTGLRSGVASS